MLQIDIENSATGRNVFSSEIHSWVHHKFTLVSSVIAIVLIYKYVQLLNLLVIRNIWFSTKQPSIINKKRKAKCMLKLWNTRIDIAFQIFFNVRKYPSSTTVLANPDQCWTGQCKKLNIFSALANADLFRTGIYI